MTSTLVAVLCLLVRADVSQPQVAISQYNTCLSQYGQVACFGANSGGQLGQGNTDEIGDKASDIALILSPIDLGDDFVVKQIAGGSQSHLCAVSVDSRLTHMVCELRSAHTLQRV